jgi:hypothetical protein
VPRKQTFTNRDRLIHIRLNDETHKRLKVLVAQQGTTLQDWVLSAIQMALPRAGGKGEKTGGA